MDVNEKGSYGNSSESSKSGTAYSQKKVPVVVLNFLMYVYLFLCTYSYFSVLNWMNPVFILSAGSMSLEPAASKSAVICLIFAAAIPSRSLFSLKWKRKDQNRQLMTPKHVSVGPRPMDNRGWSTRQAWSGVREKKMTKKGGIISYWENVKKTQYLRSLVSPAMASSYASFAMSSLC